MNRIENAARAIVARCAEITDACDAGCAARVFSSEGIRTTCDLCLDFMTAVGEVASADELRAERALFLELEDAVMRANLALAERTQENPNVVATIRMCEETLFRLLGEGDATVLVLAGLGRRFKPIVRQALHAFFTDIRRQLEASGDVKGLGKLAQALASPLTTMLITKIKPILTETGKKLEDAVKHELRTTRQKLLYAYKHPEQTTYGCHHPVAEKDKFVQRLIRSLAVPGVTFSIHAACVSIFGKDHAKTHSWLYDWCNDHKKEIENEVDYRRREGV